MQTAVFCLGCVRTENLIRSADVLQPIPAEDDPDEPIVGVSATAVWTSVVKQVTMTRMDEGGKKTFANVSGGSSTASLVHSLSELDRACWKAERFLPNKANGMVHILYEVTMQIRVPNCIRKRLKKRRSNLFCCRTLYKAPMFAFISPRKVLREVWCWGLTLGLARNLLIKSVSKKVAIGNQ